MATTALIPALALSILLISGSDAFSATLSVPSEYPTIQAGLDAAARGDTVLVAAGVYNEQLVVATPVITLLGTGRPLVQSVVPTLSVNGDSANIVGFDFTGTDTSSGVPTAWLGGHGFRVDDCDFTGGYAAVSVIGQGEILRSQMSHAWHGVQVDLGGSEVVLRQCDITDNSGELLGGGILLTDGNSASLFDCRLLRNSATIAGAAIYAEWNPGVETARLLAERCVIAENASRLGAALETSNAEVTLRSCTITRNVVTNPVFGAVLQFEGGIPVTVEVDRSIVAFNEGRALLCLGAGKTIIHCTDIFGNQDNSLCGSDGGGNLSMDPLFCDLIRGDYSLTIGSPCSADHSPPGCGLIGALEVVCLDPVLPSTWGNIKGRFIDRGHPSKSLK